MVSADILPQIQSALVTLRSQIVTALALEIGTYTFPDGTTDPAIAVLGLGSAVEIYPPKDTSVTGLEVVLVTLNSIRIEQRLDGIIQNIITQVFLKQFDTSKNTITPLFKLLSVIDIDGDPIRTVSDPYIGNIETCQMQILHSFYTDTGDL
ncbi:hypothetical protein VF14_03125 [Nostoc linckia z18]|uniref:Uncharacterized protein n=2 Tax=Nostoc linckia TaxID=92942 RepID=A0A9Q5ZGN9_NOSLI|nr:hypothetical protein [Nostoc linckia]PHK42372.1 hypothetical protein VF12_03140 [Nostoc linckia z15]PHK46813.1 hypothetical protein VF13_09010 [Nostoc linckia z16]PHJ69142.1 hypothetical protein VF02_00595 [Nostoc linckia z1]PHJ73293.1 hypothetical protein VF05_01610 [Nostoc linckia z3]PHJ78640.1 hypothetical protein VF03_00595 [Nostoc linckia z2]